MKNIITSIKSVASEGIGMFNNTNLRLVRGIDQENSIELGAFVINMSKNYLDYKL